MKLIDRYIAEVGKDLPPRMRTDIENEIRSSLQDMLEERSRKTGAPIDDGMIVEVLKAYGTPRKVAEAYQPDRYVIKPVLLHSFLTVIKVVLPIAAVIALVRLGINLGQVALTFDNILGPVIQGILEMLGLSLLALGSILVLFVIFQKFIPEFRAEEKNWDPRDLPLATSGDRVETGSSLLLILAAGLAIVVFHFFSQVISIGYDASGAWTIGFIAIASGKAQITTILSETFFSYLPVLTICWSATILLHAVLLRRGRWEDWSRWVSLVLSASAITLAAIMVSGPALVSIDSAWFMAAGFPDLQAAQSLTHTITQVVTALLVVILIGNLVNALRLLVRITGRNLSPWLEKIAHP